MDIRTISYLAAKTVFQSVCSAHPVRTVEVACLRLSHIITQVYLIEITLTNSLAHILPTIYRTHDIDISYSNDL
jgi:hypothetical protein